MLDAVDEAAPACFDDPLLEHGIRRDNVRRRDDVEDLAGRERNHVFMMTVHALYARRGGVPPLLGQQKCLHEKIIGLFPQAGSSKRRSWGSGSIAGRVSGSPARRAA